MKKVGGFLEIYKRIYQLLFNSFDGKEQNAIIIMTLGQFSHNFEIYIVVIRE